MRKNRPRVFETLIAWISCLIVAMAQEPRVESISAVNTMLRTPPKGPAHRMVFRGVVTHCSEQHGGVFLQDREAGIFVWHPDGVANPTLGSEIEVTADVQYSNSGSDTSVQALSIRLLGHPGLPAPLSVTIPEIIEGKFNRILVQIDANVLQVQEGRGAYAGIWWLVLANPTGVCMGGVYNWPAGWKPELLEGKTLRFWGVCGGFGPYALGCSSPDELKILEPMNPAPMVLKNIKDMLDLGPQKALTEKRPFSFTGVCTNQGDDGILFNLQDGDAAVVVSVGHRDLIPKFGEEVRISGMTNGDALSVWAEALAVKRMGPGSLPEPLCLGVSRAVMPAQFRRWVQTEGTVLQARHRIDGSGLQLHIADGTGWALVNLAWTPAGFRPDSCYGAKIRVRGVSVFPQILINQPDAESCFEVLVPGRQEAFDAAFTVAGGSFSSRHATVLAVEDGWVYARDATGAFRANALVPFEPGDKNWQPPVTPIHPHPLLQAGDVVDVVGLPMQGALLYAQTRLVIHGQPAEAVPVSLTAAMTGESSNELVRLYGRLKNYRTGESETGHYSNQWRETLRLEQDGSEIEAILEGAVNQPQLADLKINDRLEVVGIVRPEQGAPPFRLCLRTAADVRSLGVAPEFLRDRQIRIFTIIVGSLALAIGLILFMARKLYAGRLISAERARTDAAMLALNNELEQHVAERTSQLETAREDLRLALIKERELGQMKTAFVSLVSHEFRTPLNVIVTSADILSRYLTRLPEEERAEHLTSIQTSVKRMSGMMEDVLLLGRFESGMLKFQPQEIHLVAWCQRFVDEMQSAISSRCQLDLALGEFPPVVRADESLLRHILANLLSNAAKYSAPGESVKLHVSREGDDAVFSVEDHGIGIPASDRSRLFEAFQRGGNVGQINGTGLGLVVVKRGIEIHGGTFEFNSEEGVGTIFVVKLPLFAAADSTTAN